MRPVAGCTHQPRHYHGTRRTLAAHAHCMCRDCTAIRLRLVRSEGWMGVEELGGVRPAAAERLGLLRSHGWMLSSLAAATGLSLDCLSRVSRLRASDAVCQRLLDLAPALLERVPPPRTCSHRRLPAGRIDATQTRATLHRMRAAGMSLAEVSLIIGLSTATVASLLSGETGSVTEAVAARAAAWSPSDAARAATSQHVQDAA